MAQIALNYSAAQINAAIAKITTLVSVIEGNIVQLYDGTTAIYPRTKAEAVFFNNDTSQTLDAELTTVKSDIVSVQKEAHPTIRIEDIPADNSTTAVYLTNGTLATFGKWAKGKLRTLSGIRTITGRVYSYNSGGIIIQPIVYFDSNKEFIGVYPNTVTGVNIALNIDTSVEGYEIPSNAAYFLMQSTTNTSVVSESNNSYLDADISLFGHLDDLNERIDDLDERIIDDLDELNTQKQDKTCTINLYNVPLDNSRTEVYLANGTLATFGSWAKGEFIKINNDSNKVYKGQVLTFNTGGVNISPLVYFDENLKKIGYYPNTVTGSNLVLNIDTSVEGYEVPSNAVYMCIQSNTNPNVNISTKHIDAILSVEVALELAFYPTTKEKEDKYPEYELMTPKIVYNVGNDLTINKCGLVRNFASVLYLDNYLPLSITQEPNIRFDNNTTRLNISCYQKPRPYHGVDGTVDSPALNTDTNGDIQSLMTETVSYKINGNIKNGSQHSVINRSVLNSATEGQSVRILCVGDSVTYGQNAYFYGDNERANYTQLLELMFLHDKFQNNNSGFELITLGNVRYSRTYKDLNGNNQTLFSYNDGYPGATITSGFFESSYYYLNNECSLENWLTRFRTRDNQGRQLYYDANKSESGTGGNYGYYEDGTLSEFRIGTNISNVKSKSVCEPTHVFLFHSSNAAVTLEQYTRFISIIHDTCPNAYIGIGVPHIAGTFFPSLYPNYSKVEFWNTYMADLNHYAINHLNTQKVLDTITTQEYENNKVFVLPTYYITPAAKAIPMMEINEPYRDFIDGDCTYIAKGQEPDVHVGSIAHSAYAYQLYSWIKYTYILENQNQ